MSRDALDESVTLIDEEAGPHHAVSITGGEPLLFVDFLIPLLGKWRDRGWPILLETGGHRPDDLERILEHVDIVMADIKIESSAGFAVDAKRFLEIASQKECAAKIVCNAHTTEDEITTAARMVKDDVPLILQPVTGTAFHPPKGDHMLALQRAAMHVHERTRIIPQTHRTLHLR
jgi:organic radical activating enzyme